MGWFRGGECWGAVLVVSRGSEFLGMEVLLSNASGGEVPSWFTNESSKNSKWDLD